MIVEAGGRAVQTGGASLLGVEDEGVEIGLRVDAGEKAEEEDGYLMECAH